MNSLLMNVTLYEAQRRRDMKEAEVVCEREVVFEQIIFHFIQDFAGLRDVIRRNDV